MNDGNTERATNSNDAAVAAEGTSDDNGATTSANNTSEEEDRRRLQKKQRLVFLDHLIRDVDIMVFCQLSVLYYMDCSLIAFLIRAIPHWFYFTPKPIVFPPPPDVHRPYVGIIFVTNLICILLHLSFEPAAAGEASHGYLHGGALIDFVGQISPVSKLRLLSIDLLTLALQILVMAVLLEKHALQGKRRFSSAISALSEALDALGNTVRQQDHDAEERGVLGSDEPLAGTGAETAAQGPTSQGRTGGEEDGERDELLGIDMGQEQQDSHPLDSFHTGDYVLARVYILDTVRSQWRLRSMGTRSTNTNTVTVTDSIV